MKCDYWITMNATTKVKNMLRISCGMTSLLRVADAEAKDCDIFGRGSGFRYFTMCDRRQTNKHCHTARLDMIVASPRTD